MRRADPKKIKYKIKEIMPLKWRLCYICGDEIRLEKMWALINNTREWDKWTSLEPMGNKYFCTNCIKDRQELMNYAESKIKAPNEGPKSIRELTDIMDRKYGYVARINRTNLNDK